MNIAIIDVTETILPVYQQLNINDHDGNLLHNSLVTTMYTLFISAPDLDPAAQRARLLNDLGGYMSKYTLTTDHIVSMFAHACVMIVHRIVLHYAPSNSTHISVLNVTRNGDQYTVRIGYYECQ